MIKMIFILLLAAFATMAYAPTKIERDSCTCRGAGLSGRVRVVERGADFEVQVVEHHADLRVKYVSHTSRRCGEWTVVTSGPALKVKYVNHNHADFKIKIVNNHAGIPGTLGVPH